MATTVTSLDFSGKFALNKKLCGDINKVLVVQGIGFITRKAISVGRITTIIKHYKDAAGVEQLEIDSAIVGGITVSKEHRIVDGQARPSEDLLFGPIVTTARRAQPADLTIPFLKDGWTAETLQNGVIHVEIASGLANKNNWTMNQTWGMQEINGERRYVVHLKITSPSEDHEIMVVYDDLGSA
ncbi:hypothetical protein FB45DRAFT_902078 [Roridomyces roridus]|uniref:Uncharacterized protein n=1 Tax=Roridomyces roridus TaxID=1738132 RepID=A0AAD7C9G2_9AGAR|nr:hypothetical protein FB45DRAFT_902078 [Roridomyces roridus]